MIRCLVADDHPAVVNAVCAYLTEEGIDIVARARNGEEALAQIASIQPEVAIVDLRMRDHSGIDVAKRAAQSAPSTAVILYTGAGNQALLLEAVDAGARGFVRKEAPLAELLRAIETVAAGGTYVDPLLGAALISDRSANHAAALTQREREILRLLADGMRYRDIGKALYLSSETVRTHVRKAMERLDADTPAQAVATALRQGLIA